MFLIGIRTRTPFGVRRRRITTTLAYAADELPQLWLVPSVFRLRFSPPAPQRACPGRLDVARPSSSSALAACPRRRSNSSASCFRQCAAPRAFVAFKPLHPRRQTEGKRGSRAACSHHRLPITWPRAGGGDMQKPAKPPVTPPVPQRKPQRPTQTPQQLHQTSPTRRPA